ncbi:MAG: hypothetical protein K6E98_12255 [Lachnospiraceae bacterium]|nr:hypothetical protein [Lachnospiraceae bacterium]
MDFDRSYIKWVVILVLISALVCGGIVFYGVNKKSNSITYDRDKMVEYAHKFYAQGDIKKAISQMEYYCLNQDDVYDAQIELAGWYEQLGDEENSTKCYSAATTMVEYDKNDISVNEPFYHVTSEDISLKIEPVVGFTKNVSLTFKGENINPEGYEVGKINGIRNDLSEDDGCRTTYWTEIDKTKDSVILTGDMNCAIWQFMNDKGEIENIEDVYYEDEEAEEAEEGINVICNMGSIAMRNRPYSVVKIPDDAVKCRVTYVDESLNDRTFSDDKKVVMFYGKVLSGYSDSGSSACEIPDLTQNQYIEYADGKWTLYEDGKEKEELNLEEPAIYNGAGIYMIGDVCGRISVDTGKEKAGNAKDGEYGIEISGTNGLAVCRRLGDAVGMKFDYKNDDEWVGDGVNDFDNVYPWSDIKLCNLTYNEEGEPLVVYEGDYGFKTDGTNGNVMVEIPKFYVKRVVDGESEELWISGKGHSGYVLDPIFIDAGVEKDHVYVGAYLGIVEDGVLKSRAGGYPTVNVSYKNIRSLANYNGEGYRELGYNMYAAIQKLFMVETGCLDSTSLMAGETDLYYYGQNKDANPRNTGIALQSQVSSNKIVVNNIAATQKLEEGSSVVFLNTTDGWNAMKMDEEELRLARRMYRRQPLIEHTTDNCREIVSVSDNGEQIEITFDGAPMDIYAGETIIASYPSLTGKTGEMDYCTGYLGENNGRHGFKYRYMENIYGSEMVMLGADSYLLDGTFYFTDTNGEEASLASFVPAQKTGVDGGESEHNNTNDLCIKRMSYDPEHPTIMVPSEYGASTYSNYSDYYYYASSSDEKIYYIAVGDPMNDLRAGGLFHMRAIIDSDDFARYYCGGRIMYR